MISAARRFVWSPIPSRLIIPVTLTPLECFETSEHSGTFTEPHFLWVLRYFQLSLQMNMNTCVTLDWLWLFGHQRASTGVQSRGSGTCCCQKLLQWIILPAMSDNFQWVFAWTVIQGLKWCNANFIMTPTRNREERVDEHEGFDVFLEAAICRYSF